MVGVLMVAEKPSLARSLAEILSHKRCKRRGSACRACDVYEFEGTFPPGDKRGGSAAHFKMTSVCGHVMTLDFLPKYNKWDQVDPVSRYTVRQMCCHITLVFSLVPKPKNETSLQNPCTL